MQIHRLKRENILTTAGLATSLAGAHQIATINPMAAVAHQMPHRRARQSHGLRPTSNRQSTQFG
jgi:hypothetical protein